MSKRSDEERSDAPTLKQAMALLRRITTYYEHETRAEAIFKLRQAEDLLKAYAERDDAVFVIDDCIVWRDKLTAEEREKVEVYLAHKWGVDLPEAEPVPMLCFAHGGSEACEVSNAKNGFTCPKCKPDLPKAIEPLEVALRMNAIHSRVEGMKAANADRSIRDESMAYDSSHFFEAEAELNEIIARLEVTR